MINIHMYQSHDELGKLMSNMANTPIETGVHGWFRSIEAYWYWLQTREDLLRYQHGAECKKNGALYRSEMDEVVLSSKSDEFQQYICAAIKIKIANHPEIRKLFTEYGGAFEHRGLYNGEEVDMAKNCRWWIDFINGLSKATRIHGDAMWNRYEYSNL